MPIDLLIVGPASRDTGGVARYVTEQQRVLPGDITPRVFDVRTPPGSGWPRYLLALALTVVDWLRFPVRRRPDVVHVHTSYGAAFYRASYYILVASLVWRRPVVVHIHGSAFDEFVQSADGLARWYHGFVFDHCDRVIALSAYWKSVVQTHVPPQRIVVVPNAVDPDAYDPDPSGDPPTVVFVSNLVERKGVPEFVDALDHLARNGNPPFEADIAGDGPYADETTALANRHEEITYHGYVTEQDKRRLLEGGSVYVLPTYAEGLPIALLEGMAGANAVVTTGVGSIPEVVDDDGGIVVEPGDADQLTAAIETLLAADGDRTEMARHNRTRVEQTYSWDAVSDRLAATYRELTA